MLFLIDKHADNSTREQTLLGARMVRMELVQNRLDDDEVAYMKLTSDNEDTDLIRATILRFSAEALFMASLRANSGVIQMSLANFLR
jgi:flagellar hook-associated protein 3 FlgL